MSDALLQAAGAMDEACATYMLEGLTKAKAALYIAE
jgi:hypothetical protein